MLKLIVHCALSVVALHLLNQKTFCRTSVAAPQQLCARIAIVHFPIVNFQLFVPVPLSVASPIE